MNAHNEPVCAWCRDSISETDEIMNEGFCMDCWSEKIVLDKDDEE